MHSVKVERSKVPFAPLLVAAVVGLIVFVTALAGIELTRHTGRIAAIWISNAVLLAFMLRSSRSNWPLLLLSACFGNILANLQSGDTMLTAAMLTSFNMVEVLICAFLSTALTKDTDFRRPRPMFMLTVVAIGPACMISSALAAYTLSQLHQADFLTTLLSWYASDALGFVTITPLILVLHDRELLDLVHPVYRWRSALVFSALVATLAVIFLQTTLPLLFLAFPAIILATFCLGFPGAAMAVLLSASVGLWATLNGYGPMALVEGPLRYKIYALQLFAATSSLTSFALASLLGERNLLMAALAQAPDFHYIKNLRSQFVSANMNVVRHNNLRDLDELVGKTDFDLTEPERAELLVAEEWDVMYGDGKIQNRTESIIHARSDLRWYETSKVALRSATGRVIGLAGVTRDITARKELEAEVQAGRDRMALILSEMSDGLAVIDANGYILFCNDQYRALFPLTGEFRVAGAFLPQILLLARDRGESAGIDPHIAMQKLKSGVDDDFQLFNGEWLHVRSSPGADGNFIILVSNITPMKKAYVELKNMAKRLELLADTDGLTGLFNRRSLDEKLEIEVDRCRRNRKPISLIMIDIDRFKAFNDHYGHQAGDGCLKTVSDALADAVKRPADFVARYGGEELCVVLPETDLGGAMVLAERLRAAVKELAIEHVGSEKEIVSISIGVACLTYDGDALTPAELISRADAALYGAKRAGRDKVVCWESMSSPQIKLLG